MIHSHAYVSAGELLSKVLRSTPAQAREVGRGLAPELRVQLTLFCYGRAHLRDHGLELARECTFEDLARECGAPLANSILAQLKPDRADPGRSDQSRKLVVSLARAPLNWSALMVADDVDERVSAQ